MDWKDFVINRFVPKCGQTGHLILMACLLLLCLMLTACGVPAGERDTGSGTETEKRETEHLPDTGTVWETEAVLETEPVCETESSGQETQPEEETAAKAETQTEPAETAGTGEETETMAATYQQISQAQAREMMQRDDGHVVIDVRMQGEYDDGHIPGAILIPNESIGETPPAELPDLSQIILIYCRSGNRSKQAAEKLARMGYSRIYEFGGIMTWEWETVT